MSQNSRTRKGKNHGWSPKYDQVTARSREQKQITAKSNPYLWFFGAAIVLIMIGGSIVNYYIGEDFQLNSLSLIILIISCLSIASFALMAYDKAVAGSGATRVPEFVMHFLGLFGGWPGVLLAMALIRHKSQKAEFQLYAVLAAAVNVIILVRGLLASEIISSMTK
jgi:uncharacterized membrane protein YsdA (DUF1294 family)